MNMDRPISDTLCALCGWPFYTHGSADLACMKRQRFVAMPDMAMLRERASSLFDAIKHGDEVHQAWLKEAIECHFSGNPVPPPRSSVHLQLEKIDGAR